MTAFKKKLDRYEDSVRDERFFLYSSMMLIDILSNITLYSENNLLIYSSKL